MSQLRFYPGARSPPGPGARPAGRGREPVAEPRLLPNCLPLRRSGVEWVAVTLSRITNWYISGCERWPRTVLLHEWRSDRWGCARCEQQVRMRGAACSPGAVHTAARAPRPSTHVICGSLILLNNLHNVPVSYRLTNCYWMKIEYEISR